MKRYLESIDGLEKIEVKDIAIDLSEFKLINMNETSQDDVLYTGKFWGSKPERYLAKEHALNSLKKGNGIYCDNVVYYERKLQTDSFNIGITELKKYIESIRKIRSANRYGFEEQLKDEKYYPLVINYINMYNKGMIDIDWVKERLSDKVYNIDYVISNHFNQKHIEEKSAI